MANDFSLTEKEQRDRINRLAAVFAPNQQTWLIEKADRFYYLSGRNAKTYKEITFWYDPVSCERKETTRVESIYDGEEYKLPDWCQSCEYRRSLNYE